MKPLTVLLCALWLSALGCATVPGSAARPAAPDSSVPGPIHSAPRDDLRLAQVGFEPAAYAGRPVRWGGTILSLANRPGWTEILVQVQPLDAVGRPQTGPSEGRFLVRGPIPYDPATYAPGRRLTVAGIVVGPVVADAETLPLVAARDYYLWDQVGAAQPIPDAWTRQAAVECCQDPYPGDDHHHYRPWGWWWPAVFIGYGFRHGFVGFGSYGWRVGYSHH